MVLGWPQEHVVKPFSVETVYLHVVFLCFTYPPNSFVIGFAALTLTITEASTACT